MGNPLTIFHQLKYHGTKEEANYIWDEGQCYLQLFNTFWDTTGHEDNGYSYCYPCDSVTVLAEGDQNSDYSLKTFTLKESSLIPNGALIKILKYQNYIQKK